MSEMVELLAKTPNPKALDAVLHSFGAALVEDGQGGYVKDGDEYIVRCFGDPDFLIFAVKSQGYATDIRRPNER